VKVEHCVHIAGAAPQMRGNRTRLTIGSVLTFYAAAIGRSIEASVFGVQELEASDVEGQIDFGDAVMLAQVLLQQVPQSLCHGITLGLGGRRGFSADETHTASATGTRAATERVQAYTSLAGGLQ